MTPLEALEDTQTDFGQSRYAEYRRCPKAHWLKYEAKIVPGTHDPEDLEGPEQEPLFYSVGRLCHAILRYMQEGAMAAETRNWRDVLGAAAGLPESDMRAVHEAERLMGAYWLTYGEENAGWPTAAKILAVEKAYETALPGGSAYTGRVDTLLDIRGTLIIVDTKTRSRAFPKDREGFQRSLATRPQFLGLSWLVQEEICRSTGRYDGPPPSIWVNGIIKTTVPKFDRILVPLKYEEILRWREEQARFLPIHGDDRMNYSACAPEGSRKCSYFNFCHGSGEQRARQYRKVQ